jgi:hypothetical protein
MDDNFESFLVNDLNEEEVNKIFSHTLGAIDEYQKAIDNKQQLAGQIKTYIANLQPCKIESLKVTENDPAMYQVIVSGIEQVNQYGQYIDRLVITEKTDVVELMASGSSIGTISSTDSVILRAYPDYNMELLPVYVSPHGEKLDQEEVIHLINCINPELAKKFKTGFNMFISNSSDESLRISMFMLRECYRGIIHKYSIDDEVLKQVYCEKDDHGKPTLLSRLEYIAKEKISADIRPIMLGSIRSYKLAYTKMNKLHNDDELKPVEVIDDIKFTLSHLRALVQSLAASGQI